MNGPLLQSLPISTRPHWADPVSREETLARREKFQKVGWRLPNHKPNTEEVVAYAKTIRERHMTGCGSPLLRAITVRASDSVLSGIVSISVLMAINTY
jgi:hypothetical protein